MPVVVNEAGQYPYPQVVLEHGSRGLGVVAGCTRPGRPVFRPPGGVLRCWLCWAGQGRVLPRSLVECSGGAAAAAMVGGPCP